METFVDKREMGLWCVLFVMSILYFEVIVGLTDLVMQYIECDHWVLYFV